jgi:hypothetical protein
MILPKWITFSGQTSVARHKEIEQCKPVNVELRDPYGETAIGCCYVNLDGITTIRIWPRLWEIDREQFWRTYLHEVGHALRHSASFKWSDGEATTPIRDNDVKGQLLSIKDGLHEVEADLLEELWWRYAGDGPMVKRLMGLMNWEEGG